MMAFRWRLRAIAEHVYKTVVAILGHGTAPSPRPRVVVAPFSNGGYFVYEHLRAVLEEKNDLQMVRTVQRPPSVPPAATSTASLMRIATKDMRPECILRRARRWDIWRTSPPRAAGQGNVSSTEPEVTASGCLVDALSSTHVFARARRPR